MKQNRGIRAHTSRLRRQDTVNIVELNNNMYLYNVDRVQAKKKKCVCNRDDDSINELENQIYIYIGEEVRLR